MSLKINIKNPHNFTAHRSGWKYAMDSISKFHSTKGVLFDDFLDITFGYSNGKNINDGVIPYKQPWIGVLHHPPRICPWYEEKYRNSIDIHNFLNSTEFLVSLNKCLGIIVLSDYLKLYLETNFTQFDSIPIVSLKHPTESPKLYWNFDKYKKSAVTRETLLGLLQGKPLGDMEITYEKRIRLFYRFSDEYAAWIIAKWMIKSDCDTDQVSELKRIAKERNLSNDRKLIRAINSCQ
jgi:hypothetical protein